MGNTKSIELINKYRGQIMGFSAICIGFFIKRHYFLWFISAITATYLLFPLYWRFFSRSRSKLRFTALFAAVTLSAWLLHILTDRVLALTGSLRSRAKCAG